MGHRLRLRMGCVLLVAGLAVAALTACDTPGSTGGGPTSAGSASSVGFQYSAEEQKRALGALLTEERLSGLGMVVDKPSVGAGEFLVEACKTGPDSRFLSIHGRGGFRQTWTRGASGYLESFTAYFDTPAVNVLSEARNLVSCRNYVDSRSGARIEVIQNAVRLDRPGIDSHFSFCELAEKVQCTLLLGRERTVSKILVVENTREDAERLLEMVKDRAADQLAGAW